MSRLPALRRRTTTVLTATALAVVGAGAPAPAAPDHHAKESRMTQVIPAPVSVTPNRHGGEFRLTPATVIDTDRGARRVGEYLARVLRPSTGYRIPVVDDRRHGGGGISLELGRVSPTLGEEGYELEVDRRGVEVKAATAAGLFAGVQTLRQLFPARIEARTEQRGPWTAPAGRIVDYPRFAYRGAMLDVARHFFSPDEVKRYIDQIALYKINRLHLHLADDQGWRIEIESWPRLATYGGSTEVGGGPGGYYTKAQYRDLVAYAAERHIEIIPEIDMPGHTNAALASYPELNCNGEAPPLYTGIEVGFSSLCIEKEITYRFVEDVLTELAELTPGEYLHVGGDEAQATTEPDYLKFFQRVLPIVEGLGKKVAGWHEFLKATPSTSALPQFWGTTTSNALVAEAAERGHKILLSPANKAYLDMKYDANTPLGLAWAGFTEVDDAYAWNPGEYVQGVPEAAVLGVEAPLWSETLEVSDHIEFMAFPRLPAIAELGWSPWSTHDWESFRTRLAAQGPRWTELGIDFYRSPQIDWQ
ncbi:beta-N-acetylhexosaminidase [Actinophytocola xanthii]|uniref:beta-N-acetylhexosaminidase n=1 Tax=Actinophytocola xanthii TaxID=1912961 RepID=A0A1Q8CLL2_9PSEU|nr:beta-N-acetylhexosaminidase [Actinophytocola xanthii]OLF15245.1 beta-N-acetylhexosaminidase [Actinophytocola xanthii]